MLVMKLRLMSDGRMIEFGSCTVVKSESIPNEHILHTTKTVDPAKSKNIFPHKNYTESIQYQYAYMV